MKIPERQTRQKRVQALTRTTQIPKVSKLTKDTTRMASTQQHRETAPKNKNGQAAAIDDDDIETPAAVATPVNTDGRVPGTIPTAPHAVLYLQGDRYHVAIHHPVNGSSFIVSARGQGGAKGEAEDAGFLLNALNSKGPDWLRAKIPAGATVIGFAAIKSFPLPKQP